MSSRTYSPFFRLFLMMAVILAIVGAIYYVLIKIGESIRCSDHLANIYQAVELFEMDRGSLPTLALYPDEPLVDPDSIRVVLEEYGVDPLVWTCPSSHPKVAHLGLSYIWNTALNGSNLKSYENRHWMLIEINALSEDVPASHFGYYNVLYTDGTVERIDEPSEELEGF